MKKLSAILLAVALVVMMVPTVWGDFNDELGSASSGATVTMDASGNLTTAIGEGVTLVVPNGVTLTVPVDQNLLGSKGEVRVDAGGTLIIDTDERIGSSSLELETGASITIDLKNGLTIDEDTIDHVLATLTGNATLHDYWTTSLSTTYGIVIDPTINGTVTIASGAELRIANNSTLTINSGSIDVAEDGLLRVSSKGTITGGTINNSGVVSLYITDSSKLSGTIALQNDGVVYSEVEASASITGYKSQQSNVTYSKNEFSYMYSTAAKLSDTFTDSSVLNAVVAALGGSTNEDSLVTPSQLATITSLTLNDVDDTTAFAELSNLSGLTTLTVNVDSNNMTETGINALIEAVKNGGTITDVTVNGFTLSEEQQNNLDAATDANANNPAPNPPVVTGPSFTIVQRPAVEYWASPESSNPTEEWAEPTAPSTDSNKTNPSMGGRADA